MPVIAQHLTPAFRQVVHRLDDPDEFSVAVSGGALRADFLVPQTEPTRIEQFQSQAWAIDFHEAHVRARIFGGLPAGWASLGIMCSPHPSNWYGMDAPSGTIVCTPPGEAIDGCTAPGFRCVSVGISPRLWELCRQLAAPDRPDFGHCTAHALSAPAFARLTRGIDRVRMQLRQAALAPRLAEQAMEEATQLVTGLGVIAWELGGRSAGAQDSRRNRARLARRAEAWLREHQTQPVSVPQLCLALRVSRRELEYAFRSNFDLSPHAYLQALRLNAIRRRLLRNARRRETIAEIALANGLTHLGRFSASYRSLFGESPMETLRR